MTQFVITHAEAVEGFAPKLAYSYPNCAKNKPCFWPPNWMNLLVTCCNPDKSMCGFEQFDGDCL